MDEWLVRDLLEELGCGSGELEACCRMMGENGVVLAGQLRGLQGEVLGMLGVPLALVPKVIQALDDSKEDFDLCKICRNPFAEGHKDMLDCMHVVR
jgi:hypothetical protein